LKSGISSLRSVKHILNYQEVRLSWHIVSQRPTFWSKASTNNGMSFAVVVLMHFMQAIGSHCFRLYPCWTGRIKMASKQKMVTAVFRDRVDSQNAYEWLRNRGYTPQEINVMMSESTRSAYVVEDEREERNAARTEAAEGVGVGGAIGTALGATLGAVLAVGTMVAIPGFGLVAGPILAALAGGGAGAVTGGVIGGLVGLGIPEPNARAYHDALREGGVVIGVTPHSSREVSEIKTYFEDHQGESICYF
jgi:hypothetical protein